MQKNKGLKRIVIFVVVIAIGVGGYFVYKKVSSPAPVMRSGFGQSLIATAKRENLKEVITASGSVMLKDEIEIYAEGETNKIKTILVEEGDMIEPGQLLVEYDVKDSKEEYEKKIRDLKRDIKNAELNLQSIVLPKSESEMAKLENDVIKAEKSLSDANVALANYDTKLNQQQTSIDTAKRDLEKAEKNYSDNAKLLEVGGISQVEYEEYGDSLKKAKDTYNGALDSLEEIKNEKASAILNIKTLENSLKEAKNAVDDANNILGDAATKIKYEQQKLNIESYKTSLSDYQKDLDELVYSTKSTVSGKVTEVSVDEGTFTEENTVILKIANFDQLIVSANIEEYDAPNVKLGQKVEMTSDGLVGKVYTGTIIKINDSASAATSMMGTETVVPIEISVDNPDGVLKPNYNLDLEILAFEKENVLTVPTSAIGHDEDTNEDYIFKIDEDKTIAKTIVELGEHGEVSVEILKGINEGERVVSSISDKIVDGMSLDDLRTEAAPNGEKTKTSDANTEGGVRIDTNRGYGQGLPSGNAGGSSSQGGVYRGPQR